jgi:hypothetical protein
VVQPRFDPSNPRANTWAWTVSRWIRFVRGCCGGPEPVQNDATSTTTEWACSHLMHAPASLRKQGTNPCIDLFGCLSRGEKWAQKGVTPNLRGLVYFPEGSTGSFRFRRKWCARKRCDFRDVTRHGAPTTTTAAAAARFGASTHGERRQVAWQRLRTLAHAPDRSASSEHHDDRRFTNQVLGSRD